METIENIIGRLRDTALCDTVEADGMTLRVRGVNRTQVCACCAFTAGKARVNVPGCPYARACMGRYRPDRLSVTFRKAEGTDMVTGHELCERWGVRTASLDNWVTEGRIGRVRNGRQAYYRMEDVLRAEAAGILSEAAGRGKEVSDGR